MVVEYHRRDAYCPPCARIRERKRQDPRFEDLFNQNLWCTACGEDHPPALFSARQRREPDNDGICVAHEDHMRICQHRTLTWLDVQELKEMLAQLDLCGINSFKGSLCKYLDHSRTCGVVDYGDVLLMDIWRER